MQFNLRVNMIHYIRECEFIMQDMRSIVGENLNQEPLVHQRGTHGFFLCM